MTLKRILFFLVFFTAALAVSAVIRFPHQTAAVKINRVVEALFPELDITLDRVYPDMPPGLTAKGPVVRLYDVATVTLDEFRIL